MASGLEHAGFASLAELDSEELGLALSPALNQTCGEIRPGSESFVALPIPEPSTLVLLLGGLFGLASLRR